MNRFFKKILMLVLPIILFAFLISNKPSINVVSAYTDSRSYSVKVIETLDDFYYNGHYYAVFDSAESWSEAKSYCEGMGGHLATITSKKENDFVSSKFRNIGSGYSYWIGLTDVNSEGKWEWITGEKLFYTNWNIGEPNNQDNEDYCCIYSTNQHWNDLTDKTVCGFICEWDTQPLPYKAEFVESSNEYLNGALLYDNHLYKMFEDKKSWPLAKEHCEAMGGHLVTITSFEEDKQIFRYSNLYGYTSVYLGASDINNEGTWEWVNDELFDYTNFNVGEPNSSGDEDYLQYYTFSGGWNDTDTEDVVYICEWSEACIVGTELKMYHTYQNISSTSPTCQQKGVTIDKCLTCSYQREKYVNVVDCKYGDWKIISGSKLIPPIKKEKQCVYCGAVEKVEDWSFVWLPIVVVVVGIASIFGLINYIKLLKK